MALSDSIDVSFAGFWRQVSSLELSWTGLTANPLAASVAVLGAVTVACWLLQVLTTNYSWVDRLWSVMPPVYAWIFAAWGGGSHPRLVLMAVLVTAWGARLTFNFARKGGYKLLTLLFQGSTQLTEQLSARKYPAYRDYQRTTSRLLPLWPGRPLEASPAPQAET